jgi:6-pyruvoyltetrahydropterin/6-carboxytetrahydropterin synthase
MFEVAFETTFCATHRLRDGERFLEPLHGHDWRVEVVVAGPGLDGAGLLIDFEHLRRHVGEVAARFHYGDLNDHPDFRGQSPSAEALARYFFREIRQRMGEAGRLLCRVRVWEAPGCSASYSE